VFRLSVRQGPTRSPRNRLFATLHTRTRWRLILELFILCELALGSAAFAALAQRAILSLIVNDAQHGQITVIVKDQDVLVRVADLTKAGLRSFTGSRTEIDGVSMVSLASLEPRITFTLDEKELSVSIVANTGSLADNDIDLALAKPADLEYRSDTSGFVNYSASETDFQSWSGFFEGGISYKGGLFYSGLLLSGTKVTRGLTNYTYDDRPDLRRYTLGDTFAGGGTLGSPTLIGGISISKNFSLDPYFIRYPTQQVSGVLTTPSTIEVFRNGLLISREQVAPGQFHLNNIPGQIGQGNTDVVIRDAFGNSQQISSPYYLSPQLLEKGLNDYSYGIGFQRSNLADSWQYDKPAFTAFHRIGLSNWLTVGGRLEASQDLVSGGPSMSLGLGVGEIDSAFAMSKSRGGDGAAGSIAYQYTTPRGLGGGASLQWMSANYSTLELLSTVDRPIIQGVASFSTSLKFHSTLITQYSYERFRDTVTPTQHQISATLNTQIGSALTLRMTATAALPGSSNGTANQLSIGLSYYFGHRTTGTLSASHTGDHLSASNQGTVALQKSLPAGNGYGFLVQATEGQQAEQAGIFQYQNSYGRYEANYTRTVSGASSTLLLAGGLCFIGSRLIATRPVQDGFALIRVPELAGIPGEWSNQVMGTTDHHGDLLIPNLLPYYGNQLSILESSIPLNYVVDTDRKTIAVPFRGGALVEFPVHKIQQVTGKVLLRSGTISSIPVAAQLSMSNKTSNQVSPLGGKGEFYFENLPAGHYAASIDSKSGSCKFEIEIPNSDKVLIRLPTQYCDEVTISRAQ
jgi:outer membrane usher protein